MTTATFPAQRGYIPVRETKPDGSVWLDPVYCEDISAFLCHDCRQPLCLIAGTARRIQGDVICEPCALARAHKAGVVPNFGPDRPLAQAVGTLIQERHRSGESAADLAAAFDLSLKRVRQILRARF